MNKWPSQLAAGAAIPGLPHRTWACTAWWRSQSLPAGMSPAARAPPNPGAQMPSIAPGLPRRARIVAKFLHFPLGRVCSSVSFHVGSLAALRVELLAVVKSKTIAFLPDEGMEAGGL